MFRGDVGIAPCVQISYLRLLKSFAACSRLPKLSIVNYQLSTINCHHGRVFKTSASAVALSFAASFASGKRFASAPTSRIKEPVVRC